MSTRVVDRVDDWDERPFDGGYAGMAELAADEFSGVVRAGGAEVYLTGGTVVAVRRGSIEDIEGASGTTFRAPDPALPLLAVMQADDADVRAEYYSEETPISEVDRTLSDGGFTGFLELSENVLSGDYYVVYHGGTSSSVAFVGASEQLISGDEAFEKADGEVGIYRVRQVDIEPVDVPEPTEPAATSTAADDTADAEEADAADDDDPSDEERSEAADDGDAEPTSEPSSSADDDADDDAEPPEPTPSDSADGDGSSDTEPVGGGSAQQGGQAARTAAPGTASSSSGQATDLETRGVPSLDPGQTTYPRRPSDTSPGSTGTGGAPADSRDHPGGRASGSGARAGGAATAPQTQGRGEAAGAELADLERDLADREDEIEELEAELEAARSDQAELEAELESVREERDTLASEAEQLREELGRLEEELGAATDAEHRMSPAEAIEGTNLFVDYESKGRATLAKAHGGAESRDELVDNLQLGVHTEFDQGAVAVSGRDFTEFLHDTIEYRFAEWVVGQLLFEIRETGHAESLEDLYDAIPEIRRVEFDGAVEVTSVEDGEEQVMAERFDVIFRHRMGDPLLVANVNDSRDPATGSMMTSLVTTAERVGHSEESLAAAFLVTSSFFESEALETVAEATKGGLLSRDKRTSFVNLSRKAGYHLCLVAAREGNFHMEVPEL